MTNSIKDVFKQDLLNLYNLIQNNDTLSSKKLYEEIKAKYFEYTQENEEYRILYDLEHYFVKGSISKEDILSEISKILS